MNQLTRRDHLVGLDTSSSLSAIYINPFSAISRASPGTVLVICLSKARARE
jgi:hypothetical protein